MLWQAAAALERRGEEMEGLSMTMSEKRRDSTAPFALLVNLQDANCTGMQLFSPLCIACTHAPGARKHGLDGPEFHTHCHQPCLAFTLATWTSGPQRWVWTCAGFIVHMLLRAGVSSGRPRPGWAPGMARGSKHTHHIPCGDAEGRSDPPFHKTLGQLRESAALPSPLSPPITGLSTTSAVFERSDMMSLRSWAGGGKGN
eukprot:scaffold9303_cov18-Tisochrysis_lutea.AAC.1